MHRGARGARARESEARGRRGRRREGRARAPSRWYYQRLLDRLRRLSLEREREDDELCELDPLDELDELRDPEVELDELELELDELELELDELDELLERFGTVLGAVFNHSRMSSVSAPREMEVKKLMLNRVLRGSSLGMMPWKYSRISGFCIFSLSCFKPSASASSWNRILIKIRELDVVASSVSWMYARHVHDMASVASKCAKNFATLRSLFVSKR